MAKLILPLLSSPSCEEIRMENFAHWIGIQTKHEPILGYRKYRQAGPEYGEYLNTHYAIDADRLNAQAGGLDLKSTIMQRGANLLILNCTGTAEQASELHKLTNGRIAAIAPPEPVNGSVMLGQAISSLSPLLAGLSFTQTKTPPLASFVLFSEYSDAEVLLSVANRPLMIRIPWGAGSLFCSTIPLPDLTERLAQANPLEDHLLSLLPPLLFLRGSFGDRCWHPVARTAQLLLDDPLLVHRYGYVDFDRMLDSITRAHYSTTLAFIPWNSWRTTKHAVQRWLTPSSGLSLCVHGCDHTRREFADSDAGYLYGKAMHSLRRMQKQKADTGADFDPVMVYPQGFFSTAALTALRQADYLAAVNTSLLAVDHESDTTNLGDALLPATMYSSGFPLFQRHPPHRSIDFAMDLFLGKPALAVRHPIDFRDGYAQLERFFTDLRHRAPDLTWQPLSEQFMRCCLHRTLDDDSQAIRFFTRKFQFARGQSGSCCIRLCKFEPNHDLVRQVLLDGNPVDFDFAKNDLCLEIRIDDSDQHMVEIIDQPHVHTASRRDGVLYRSRVLARRLLSEVRDRQLCKHDRFYKMALRIVRRARLSANP
jgi:hypothetical protein